MGEAFALPDGASAVLRDPQSVTRGQRLPYELAAFAFRQMQQRREISTESLDTPAPPSAISGIAESEAPGVEFRPMTLDDLKVVSDLEVAAVLCMVESWSYGFDVSIEGFDQIPAFASDELGKECLARADLTFFAAPVAADESNPTTPSND